jgi:hypothetical protein
MKEGLLSLRRVAHVIQHAQVVRRRTDARTLIIGALGAVVAMAAVAFVVPAGAVDQTGNVVAHADPASNLPDLYANSLAAVNAGRALEGLAPISDSRFTSFTSTQEMFVIINLERTARGLPAFQAMTSSLDTLAQIGADDQDDPPLPTVPGATAAAGTLWAGTNDPLFADFAWMYEDGCTVVAHQAAFNTGCSAVPPDPWEHRTDILEDFAALGAGCNLVMGVALNEASIGVLTEGYCGPGAPTDEVFTWGQAIEILQQATSPVASAPPSTQGACVAPTGTRGYRFVGSDGGVFDFGNFPFCGSTGNIQLAQPVVGMASTSDKGGYWLAASDGGVFAFDAPVVGIAGAPFGNGYWLVASDGGVFAFGAARYYGSMGGTGLDKPIVGIAVAPFGLGYWLVASDGGVFAFGGARYYGSMGGSVLSGPIVGMAASPFGTGYWLVASDGGVFAFGYARFYGSMGNDALSQPIVGMAAAPLGLGYWLVAADGGVFGFGDGTFYGSTGGIRLNRPIVGIAS